MQRRVLSLLLSIALVTAALAVLPAPRALAATVTGWRRRNSQLGRFTQLERRPGSHFLR